MSLARYRPNPWTPLLPMMLLFLTICATSAEDVTSGQAPATAPATALPEAAVAILTSEHDQEAALRAKLDQDLAKLHQATITRLRKVEDRALSAKDLDGAEAVKAAIVTLSPKADPEQTIDPAVIGTYKVSKCNWEVREITLREDGIALTSLGDKETWALTNGMLTISWTDGSISRGEYHPGGINLQSTGKTVSGDERCNFTLTKE